ncbi:MAG: hypothetical protein C4289_07815 [Chloroflexota bacterium]
MLQDIMEHSVRDRDFPVVADGSQRKQACQGIHWRDLGRDVSDATVAHHRAPTMGTGKSSQ